jgi:prophage antirepressor-like protein
MSKDVRPENHVVVFIDHKIRRIFLDDVWWFSVIDVIQVLTDSVNPRDYWYKMKIRALLNDWQRLEKHYMNGKKRWCVCGGLASRMGLRKGFIGR